MKLKIEVSPWLFVFLAGGILILPVHILIGALLAVFVHELAHLLALLWCNVPVYRICLGLRGARIHTGFMTAGQESVCAAAGPAGSFLLLSLWDWFPPAAAIGVAQGLYNLLPVYPLDGGRVLCAVLEILIPNRSKAIAAVISVGTLFFVPVILSSAVSAEAGLLGAGLMLATCASRNISCKDGNKRVQ